MSEFNLYKDEYPVGAKNFIDYVQRTYIGAKGRAPMFSPDIWNLYRRILDNDITTNNSLEAFNRTFNGSACRKSNVWQTVTSFQREDRLFKQRVSEMSRGIFLDQNPGKKRRSLEKHNFVKNIVLKYEDMLLEEYFHSLVYKV